jgi:hypothetical protein
MARLRAAGASKVRLRENANAGHLLASSRRPNQLLAFRHSVRRAAPRGDETARLAGAERDLVLPFPPRSRHSVPVVRYVPGLLRAGTRRLARDVPSASTRAITSARMRRGLAGLRSMGSRLAAASPATAARTSCGETDPGERGALRPALGRPPLLPYASVVNRSVVNRGPLALTRAIR